MNGIDMRTFESASEALRTLIDLGRGPGLARTLLSLDGQFREKVILAESITNNCGM